MSRVLVLNPPTSDNQYINRDQMGGMGQKISFGESWLVGFIRRLKSNFIRQPVMQLVYAATILSENHKVKVIDALNEGLSYEMVMKKIKNFKPEFTIMAVSSSDIEFEKQIGKEIKRINGKVITVGDTISNRIELFDNSFDISIEGEVETIIEKIVNNENLDKIPGIIFLRENKVVRNKKREFMGGKDLDNLPFPKWELFPYKKYRYYPLILKEPVVSMLSSRGCPYACYYCSYSKNEGRFLRNRSAENVVDEMMNLKKYRIKGVIFRDPLFTGNKERVKKICRLLIEKKAGLIWGCETRPELVDIELLSLMKRAGCNAINFGIESINEKELKEIGRVKLDLKHLREVLEHTKKIGINITGFFILGLPGATKKSMDKTISFSRNSGLGFAEYKIATPYPGTKLYDIALEKGWMIKFKGAGGYDAMMQVNKEISPEYLNKLCDRSFREFYYNPKWIFWQLRYNSLEKIRMMVKSVGRTLMEC